MSDMLLIVKLNMLMNNGSLIGILWNMPCDCGYLFMLVRYLVFIITCGVLCKQFLNFLENCVSL